MSEPKSEKSTSKTEQRTYTNRTKCVERVIAAAKLQPGVAVVWREILSGYVTYTRGVPIADIVKRLEGYMQHPRPDEFVLTLRRLAHEHVDAHGLVLYALAVLADQGLVRVGTDKRKRFDLTLNTFVKDELPWVWPLPIEAWPEHHFLAALALRIDQEDSRA